MGNFYVNCSVRTSDQKRVADTLRQANRSAFVAPVKNYVVVYDEAADTQDTETILHVGELLSRELQAPALAVLNHDDDVFCYWLFDRGKLTDSYNSCPDYFDETEGDGDQGGNAQLLCQVLQPTANPDAVEECLRADHTFAVELHQQLAKLLDLPACSVGYGYGYVADGELDEGIDGGEVIRTP